MDFTGKVCDPCNVNKKLSMGTPIHIAFGVGEEREAYIVDACLNPKCESYQIAEAIKVIRKYGESVTAELQGFMKAKAKLKYETVQVNTTPEKVPFSHTEDPVTWKDGNPPEIETRPKSSKEMSEEEIHKSFLESESYKEKEEEEYPSGPTLWEWMQEIKVKERLNSDKAPKHFGISEHTYRNIRVGGRLSPDAIGKIAFKTSTPYSLVQRMYHNGVGKVGETAKHIVSPRYSFNPDKLSWKCVTRTGGFDEENRFKICDMTMRATGKTAHAKSTHKVPGLLYCDWEPIGVPEGIPILHCPTDGCGGIYFHQDLLDRHLLRKECPDLDAIDRTVLGVTAKETPKSVNPTTKAGLTNRAGGLHNKAILSGEGQTDGINGRIG